MPVREQKILDKVPLSRKNKPYPLPGEPNLPRGYFLAGFIGRRGTGKTHLACQLIKMYEHAGLYDPTYGHKRVPIRTILIAPTADQPVFENLETLSPSDVHRTFSQQLIETIVEDIKYQKESAERFQAELAVFKRWKAGARLSPEDTVTIRKLDYNRPGLPKNARYELPPVTFLIIDDLGETSTFMRGSKNFLTNFLLRNRHVRCCVLLLVQSAKALPPAVRQNCSLVAVSQFADEKYLEQIAELVSAFLGWDDFLELYRHATRDRHGFLCIDTESHRITRNFTQELHLSHHDADSDDPISN